MGCYPTKQFCECNSAPASKRLRKNFNNRQTNSIRPDLLLDIGAKAFPSEQGTP
jgi:hypothetical protein